MDKLELKALGKLNLGLDILGQMENGYHEVRMVMQTVYLYDRVLLEKTEGDEIQIQSNLAYLPNNENNIAYKAAAILKEEFHIKGGIRITLEKHIPVAAGMGNVLEQVMIPEYPVIGEIKEMMLETGALGAMMSGSGPTVFGIYKTRGAAKEGARKIKSRGLARQVYVTNVHNVRRKP